MLSMVRILCLHIVHCRKDRTAKKKIILIPRLSFFDYEIISMIRNDTSNLAGGLLVLLTQRSYNVDLGVAIKIKRNMMNEKLATNLR